MTDDDTRMIFEGFPPPDTIDVGGVDVRVRIAGSGPPVVLLHGHPQTHAMWHRVAPALARDFRVICPDLPGYGGTRLDPSSLPLAATKDAMARRILALLDTLGVGAFSVVGHDLGGRVAHRLALIAPARVRRLALLGLVPVPEPYGRSDMAFALATYRSFWFAQTHPKPEALLQAAPGEWFDGTLPGAGAATYFHPEAVADYLAHLPGPEAIAALNETHRRATELDLSFERIDPVSRNRIACPLLVLWGRASAIGGWYDPVSLWRDHIAGPMDSASLEGGHFLAEECPDAVLRTLAAFLAAEDGRGDPSGG